MVVMFALATAPCVFSERLCCELKRLVGALPGLARSAGNPPQPASQDRSESIIDCCERSQSLAIDSLTIGLVAGASYHGSIVALLDKPLKVPSRPPLLDYTEEIVLAQVSAVTIFSCRVSMGFIGSKTRLSASGNEPTS